MNKKPKVNSNCSVLRCRAKTPHLNDPVVAALLNNFSDLARVDCSYLDHARKRFAAGKDKVTVLAELIELHLPRKLAASMAKLAAVRFNK